MKIEKTNVLDITRETLDISKIQFANNFIEKIAPTIDIEYNNLLEEYNTVTNINNQFKRSITINKSILEKLSNELKKKRKQEKLISIVAQICDSEKLLNNSEVKNQAKTVLRTIDTLLETKIDTYIIMLQAAQNNKQRKFT